MCPASLRAVLLTAGHDSVVRGWGIGGGLRIGVEAGLRQRGSLTIWFSEEGIQAWRAAPRTTRGGQPRYSAVATETALTLRALFHLAFRPTEGLIGLLM